MKVGDLVGHIVTRDGGIKTTAVGDLGIIVAIDSFKNAKMHCWITIFTRGDISKCWSNRWKLL